MIIIIEHIQKAYKNITAGNICNIFRVNLKTNRNNKDNK